MNIVYLTEKLIMQIQTHVFFGGRLPAFSLSRPQVHRQAPEKALRAAQLEAAVLWERGMGDGYATLDVLNILKQVNRWTHLEEVDPPGRGGSNG